MRSVAAGPSQHDLAVREEQRRAACAGLEADTRLGLPRLGTATGTPAWSGTARAEAAGTTSSGRAGGWSEGKRDGEHAAREDAERPEGGSWAD